MKRNSSIWICLLVSLIVTVGCHKRCDETDVEQSETHDTKWYIAPPDGYKHVSNKKHDEVFQWLQGQPYQRSFLTKLVPCPYTFDEWVNRGKEIIDIEEALQRFYRDYTGEVRARGILEAFSYVGTFRSVQFLIEVVKDEEMDCMSRSLAIMALGTIGDPSAVDCLMGIAESVELTEGDMVDGLERMRKDALGALTAIEHPKAVPIIKAYIETIDNESTKAFFQNNFGDFSKMKKAFTKDWILRWHLRNEKRNFKELPYFRSRKKWVKAGKEIPEVGRILLELLKDGDDDISKYSILVALGGVGSIEDSRDMLEVIIRNEQIGIEAKIAGFLGIYEIGGDSIIDNVIARVETAQYDHKEAESITKSALLSALSGRVSEDKLASIRQRVEELDVELYGDVQYY